MRQSARAVEWTVLGLLCCAAAVHAQSSGGTQVITPMPTPSGGGRPSIIDPNSPSNIDEFRDSPSLRIARMNARRDDLKKRMDQNADRLLQLTAQVQADLQRGELTEADTKRLDEIAKLARAVRDGMRQ